MNVTPSNQTLILAGEPPYGGTARLVASGTASKRAAIPAGRPDSTVVVRSDHLPREDARSFDSQPPVLEHFSRRTVTTTSRNSGAPTRPAAASSYRHPIQLYARTQRGLEDTPNATLLDVFA